MAKITTVSIISKEVSPIVEKAQSLKIIDSITLEQASDFRSKLKQEEKRIQLDKDKVLKPLVASEKEIRSRYKPAENIIATALNLLNSAMSTYQMNQMKTLREQEEKIANRIGEGSGHFTIETASRKIGELAPITAPTSTKFRSSVELEYTSEKDIPREYLIPDRTAIFEDLKKGIEIKGCRLKEILIPINARTKNE